MGDVYFGGCSKVEVYAAGQSTTALFTATEFAEEGNQWPVPQPKTDNLANSQKGITGTLVPFSVRALNTDSTEVTAIQGGAFSLTRYDIWFYIPGSKKMVVSNVLLRVLTSPINADGKYGFVLIEGEGSAGGSDAAYTVSDVT